MALAVSSADAGSHTEFYRGFLHEMMELGAGLARRVCEDEALAVAEATVAFERVSRTVRKCIALARVLDLPVRASRVAARRRIIRAVEDRIQVARGGAEAEELRAELAERLDRPELADEIGDRPVEAVIEDICRDLGIAALPGTRPWMRRTPEDVAGLHRRAAAVVGLVRDKGPHPALRGHSTGGGPRNLGPLRPLPEGEGEDGPGWLHPGRFRGK